MKLKATMLIQGKRNYMDQMEFFLHNTDMAAYGYFTVAPLEVEFEVPDDFNPVQGEIALLQQTKEKINQEAMARMRLIEDQIRNLQCLTYHDSPTVC